MTPYERNLAEMFHASLAGDVAMSARVSEAVYRLTPAEWTAQAHARALMQVARYKRAAQILDSLSASATADDPQFWADYARTLHMLGDHSRELRVARRAKQLMPDRRGVRSFEITALIALDSADAALRAVEEAVMLPVERDAANNPITTLGSAAGEFRAHGRDDFAEKIELRANPFLEALELDGGGQTIPSLLQLGQNRLALDFTLKARARNPGGVLSPYLGLASAALGDTATALKEMKRIEKAAREFRPYTSGSDVAARARIAAALGHDREAIMLTRQALAQGQGLSMRRQIHWGSEFRHLKRNPELTSLMKPRDN